MRHLHNGGFFLNKVTLHGFNVTKPHNYIGLHLEGCMGALHELHQAKSEIFCTDKWSEYTEGIARMPMGEYG